MNINNLRAKLLWGTLFGVVVFAALIGFGDFKQVVDSLGAFRWELLPLILLVTCGNYGLRFIKWEYYLRQIGVSGLARLDSFLIYFSGLAMVITPGKVGEWLKVYLLKEVHGTAVTRSAPIVLAERLTDSLALLIIAGAGVIVFGEGMWWVVAIIGVGSIAAIAIARHRPTAKAILRMLGRVPLVNKFIPHMDEMYESTYLLMEPRGVGLMTGLSVGSWFFEVLAFYLTLIGLGIDGSADTLLKAAFILPIATLAAAIAFITPGGLGVGEGLITTLSLRLFDELSRGSAVVGTLIIRIATLWFGVIVGLVAFAFLMRRMARQGKHLSDMTPDPDPEPALEPGTP